MTWIDSTDASHVAVCDACDLVLGVWDNRDDAAEAIRKHQRTRDHRANYRAAPKRASRRRPYCSIQGCNNPHRAHGLCAPHLNAKRRQERHDAREAKYRARLQEYDAAIEAAIARGDYVPGGRVPGVCAIDGCGLPRRSKGLCERHRMRRKFAEAWLEENAA